MRTVAMILACTSATLAEVPAQEASDFVPRELAVALLDTYGASPKQVEIVVGRLPRSFPIDALPRDDVRILGGVERYGGATVAARFPEHPDTAAARMAAHLQRAGWRRAEMESGLSGGFVPRPVTPRTTFCRANAVLSYSARANPPATGSLVHVSVGYPDAGPSCSTLAQRARAMRGRDRSLLPTLETPADARFVSSAWGPSNRDSQEAHVRLETSRTAAATGAHYAELLRREAWQVSAPTVAEGVVVYRVRGEKDSRRLSGALIVLDVEHASHLDVTLRVATPDTLR